jgi:hypothetical protein
LKAPRIIVVTVHKSGLCLPKKFLTNIFDQLLAPVIWIDSAACEINSYTCKNRENVAVFTGEGDICENTSARPTCRTDMTKNGTFVR